jgi:Mn-dependent DtxR family transcriptional regulator
MKNSDAIARLLDVYVGLGLSQEETLCQMHLLALAERGAVSATVGQIAERMAIHPGSVKRLLSGLRTKGVVERDEEGNLVFTESFKESLLWE